MAEHKKIDEATGVETVGHEWDGIEELNNPLPRWWVLTFYACILFAIGYVVVYPAIPGLHKASDGVWKWSSRGALAAEVAAADKARGPVMAAARGAAVTDPAPRGRRRWPSRSREPVEGRGTPRFATRSRTSSVRGRPGRRG